jgi:hypothetical protein
VNLWNILALIALPVALLVCWRGYRSMPQSRWGRKQPHPKDSTKKGES